MRYEVGRVGASASNDTLAPCSGPSGSGVSGEASAKASDMAAPSPHTSYLIPHTSAPAVGVMGGTFDPIHLGHLILAEQARASLGLDRVLFVPAGQPWRKAGRQIAPVTDRVEMVRAALAGDPYFELSLVESEREGPSYTADTL